MFSKILYRGAEAVVSLENNQIKKHRIKKSYRISQLDEKLRRLRTRSEAKIIEKLKNIVDVPKIIKINGNEIIMENIEGKKLSDNLDSFPLKEQKKIMKKIGEIIAKIHEANIIHGDLTTSNMILGNEIKKDNSNKSDLIATKKNESSINSKLIRAKRDKSGVEVGDEKDFDNERSKPIIYLIDFGLGFQNGKYEDKAVDLHLLKQALEAKHFKNWKELFREFEKSYSSTNKIESKKVFERLKAVERRGRYRH